MEIEFIHATTKHEAGHWIAAKVLGLGCHGIIIRVPEHRYDNNSLCEIGKFPDFPSIESINQHLRSRIIGLYAGVKAECYDGSSFDYKRIEEELLPHGGAWSDWFQIQELYRYYYRSKPIKASFEDEWELLNKACEKIVIENYKFITIVAAHVYSMANFVGQEIHIPESKLNEIYALSRD